MNGDGQGINGRKSSIRRSYELFSKEWTIWESRAMAGPCNELKFPNYVRNDVQVSSSVAQLLTVCTVLVGSGVEMSVRDEGIFGLGIYSF